MADKWVISVTATTGVQYEGTWEEAQKHRDLFIEHLKGIYAEKGFLFLLRDVRIEKKPEVVQFNA